MYVITGATGNVGREVAKAMLELGHRVRVIVRSADALIPAGAEPVVGDLDHPETVVPALADATGLFLLPGYRGAAEILAAAKRAGVDRLVQLSGTSAASGDRSNAVTRYMLDSEEIARTSGLAWTVVRPSMFASNALQWRDQLRAGDVIRAPFGGVRAAVIHPADIGAVVAVALTESGHDQQTYRISGPDATTPAERVAVLAEVLGRDLHFEGQSDDEARESMAASMPAEYVDAFFDFYVAGSLDESPVLLTVAEITGRQPRTFRDWVVEHAGDFG